MKDALGRNIEYLRLSVTDGCNLRCLYCRPSDGGGSGAALSCGDIALIVRAFSRLGVHKVRITGGEPLLRHDILGVTRAVASQSGVDDVAMTTNATRLHRLAGPLKQAGLMRLNISLDSLDEAKFRRMTGGDVRDVLRGIYEAIDAGLGVKVNAVPVRGVNDDEIDALIGLAKDLPLHVRFIELMPLGPMDPRHGVPHGEIVQKRPWLVPLSGAQGQGVATLYTVEGYSGQIGFISPMTQKFCSRCNRVRVTSDGRLKPCLGNNAEINLTPYLQDEAALVDILRGALYHKPEGHCFDQCAYTSRRSMDRIGG